MEYSYNLNRKEIVFASTKDINASFKDLCAVCDAVRYQPVTSAIGILDGVINEGRAIEYRRHNKYMGSRHELGGKKGRFPKKCAAIVRKVIVNAYANARNKGQDPEIMYVVHATANKTIEIPRAPPKGVRSVRGNYGYGSSRRSNIEFAKVEIGLANKETPELGARMKRALSAVSKRKDYQDTLLAKKAAKAKPTSKSAAKPAPKPTPKPLEAPTTEAKPSAQPKQDSSNQSNDNNAT